MQLNNVDNVSFGRIGFANKSVKKAFYSSLDNPRFTSRNSNNRSVMYCFSKWLIECKRTVGLRRNNSKFDKFCWVSPNLQI